MKTGNIEELEVEAHVRLIRGLRPHSPDLADDPHGWSSALSKAQLRFARRHDATAGTDSAVPEAVFFYRRTGRGTERWLVDSEGRVLDHAFLS